MSDKRRGQKPKIPKNKEIPQSGKHAETKVDPNAYKSMNIAWRLNRVDDDSDWGLRKMTDRITCEIHYEDISVIVDSQLSDSSFYDAVLDTSDGTYYENIPHYFKRITEKVTGLIDPTDLQIVSRNIDFTFSHTTLLEELKAQENMTWDTIEKAVHGRGGKSKNHEIPVYQLVKEAKQRLRDLDLDERESLFSLRLSGKKRVWGIRNFNVLEILWIDPDHQIYEGDEN